VALLGVAALRTRRARRNIAGPTTETINAAVWSRTALPEQQLWQAAPFDLLNLILLFVIDHGREALATDNARHNEAAAPRWRSFTQYGHVVLNELHVGSAVCLLVLKRHLRDEAVLKSQLGKLGCLLAFEDEESLESFPWAQEAHLKVSFEIGTVRAAKTREGPLPSIICEFQDYIPLPSTVCASHRFIGVVHLNGGEHRNCDLYQKSWHQSICKKTGTCWRE
jgi:hypothetical protein